MLDYCTAVRSARRFERGVAAHSPSTDVDRLDGEDSRRWRLGGCIAFLVARIVENSINAFPRFGAVRSSFQRELARTLGVVLMIAHGGTSLAQMASLGAA